MKIDLTTPAAALAYLRSLPADYVIEIPDKFDPAPESAAVTAVSVITGETAYNFAASEDRWIWTVSELIAGIEN